MQEPTQVSPQQFADSLKQQTEDFLKSVMDTVNLAPDGQWIAGSEERVRDLADDFRCRVFEQAVQQRIDAAEAAFPPSERNGDRSGHAATRQQTAPQ